MALEVGIVGPAGSGKTSLFTALTRTGGGEYGKTNVGMAPIADERLDALAQVVSARKITPATIRVQDVPGAGEAQLGNLRQVDALLVVLAGFGAGRRPGRRPRDLQARAARRRPRPRRAAPRARREAGEVRRREAAGRGRGAEEGARARRRGRRADRLHGRAAAGARAADDEADDRGRERPGRDRPALEAELAELPEEEAAAFRDGGESALDEIARPAARRARPDHVLHRGREGDARVDAPPRARPRSTRRTRSTPTSRAGSSAAR